MRSSSSSVLNSALAEAFRPDPRLTVSEHADAHRVLSQRASAEPGRWRTARVPYLREIMDCLSSSSPVQEVDVMKGAQLGLTEGGTNWINYVIDHAPAPMLCVQPTVDMQKRNVRTRIDPMIADSPRLRDKIAPSRSRDGGNSTFSKEFPGGVLILTGANSAAALRSLPARYLFLDEIDAYPDDLDGEGDPLELARARSRTFGARRKQFAISTPTTEGLSKIARRFREGDQRRYFVPCPHCNHRQWLRFDRLNYDEDKPGSPVRYACENCSALIDEHHKTAMLNAGEWVPTAECANPLRRSYHVSSLYSPVGWYSWADAAADWRAAKGNPSKERAFINTVLGDTYAEKGDAPEWRRLYDRREDYAIGTVPAGGLVLFAGVDVQGGRNARLEVEVVAYGPNMESWSVDYRVFPGDITDLDAPDGPWAQLADMLDEQFEREGGGALPIRIMAVDAGFATSTVHAWTRKFPSNRVIPVRGQELLGSVVGQPSQKDINRKGKRIRRGVQEWKVGDGVTKTELYGWLKQESPLDSTDRHPFGFCHFPEYGEEYFRQLTAEQMVLRIARGGRSRYVWETTRDRNEALDCRRYARAAAAVAGVDRWRENVWAEIREELDTPAPEPGKVATDSDFSIAALVRPAQGSSALDDPYL